MKDKTYTPISAIREHCLECQGFSPSAVRKCQSKCRFYLYRLGKHPNRQGIGGFKTHRKNCQIPTQVPDSGAGFCDSGAVDAKYAPPPKSRITIEEAERIIRAANSIIDAANNLKPVVV